MRFEAEFLSHDLHAVLGVSSTATPEQIRAAYRREVRASHPDLNPHDPEAGRRMALLNRAARVLLDPALLRQYERARGRDARGKSADPAGRWYESNESADLDWRAPDASPAAAATPAQRAFRRRVRRAGAGLAARAQDALRRVGNEQRLALAALCILLGSGLLVWSHPSNAFWNRAEAQTASAEP
jgi:curved DNA-binding protein CbpA